MTERVTPIPGEDYVDQVTRAVLTASRVLVAVTARPLEGLVVSAAGVLAVTVTGVVPVLAGVPVARAETAAMVAACAVALYLLITRAGKLLVGAVALAGVLLALLVPRTTAGSVLAEAGQHRDVVVTSVAFDRQNSSRDARYLCSVRHADGTPVMVRLWRGCGPAVIPGDRIGMVYDPSGRVPPRGVTSWTPLWPVAECVLLAAGFAVLCRVSVVRSYRLAPPAV